MSVVAPARPSAATRAKAATKRTAQGEPVHSLRTLLADLGTLKKNEIVLPEAEQHRFLLIRQPTPLQQQVFDLLKVQLKV
ncbi:MAG: hypothetical protein Kow00109_05870 [Acidobacteriota bacterium]